MKKILLVLVITAAVGGAAFAQAVPWGYPGAVQTDVQIVKAEGKLSLINGIIGLKSGGKTYYVPMLGRLTGFVDGLKEGASVKVEGYEYPNAFAPEYSTLAVTKLTLNGKEYDMGQFYGYGRGMGFGGHGRLMAPRAW